MGVLCCHSVDFSADVVVLSAVPMILYAAQHYLSIVGSLILIPLVIVPAMDGTPVSDENSANMAFSRRLNWEFCFQR